MTIKPAIQNIFHQLKGTIQSLNNDDYSRPSPTLNKATIGQHVRHTLEFFKCLLEGYPSGKINYDLRKRDLFLESNILEAISEIIRLEKMLDEITENPELVLEQSYDDEPPFLINTNLERELIYNIEHAVHHMALIRIGIKELKPDFQFSEDFGVASSTLRYRRAQIQKA